MYKEFNDICVKLDKGRDDLMTNGSGAAKIFAIDYNRDKTKSDIRSFINANFQTIFNPGSAPYIP